MRFSLMIVVVACIALFFETPSSAQFGGLENKRSSPGRILGETPGRGPNSTPFPLAPPERTSVSLDAGEERLLAAMKRKVSVKFQDQTLTDVLKWVSKDLSIPVHCAEDVLGGAGIYSEVKISFVARDIEAGEALTKVLRAFSLRWAIAGEVVFVTDTDGCGGEFLRLYDVADLVACGDANGIRNFDTQPLRDLVMTVTGVPRPGWTEDGGTGSIGKLAHGKLLIVQSEEAHNEIGWLLSGLRRVQTKYAATPVGTVLETEIVGDQIAVTKRRDVERALKAPAKFDFTDVPLKEVVKKISQAYKLEVTLDDDLLESTVSGIGDSPIQFQMEGVSLGTALKLMLRPLNLSYSITPPGVTVTANQREGQTLETRLYPVRDLLATMDDFGAREEALRELKEAIQNNLGVPQPGWVDDGGIGVVVVQPRWSLLVVSQVRAVHEQIEEMLAAVRKTARQNLPLAKRREPQEYRTRIYWVGIDNEGKLIAKPEQLETLMEKLLPQTKWDAPGAFLRAVGDRVFVRHSEEVLRQVQSMVENELRGLLVEQSPYRDLPPMSVGGGTGGLPGGGGGFF